MNKNGYKNNISNNTTRFKWGLDLFPICDIGADIGTDHGKMAIELLKQNRCKSIIATDISQNNLSKAEKVAKKFCLMDRICFRRGDGLHPLSPGEVDVAIIAGMGGGMLIQILEEGYPIATEMKNLLLQPMQHIARLRCYLRQTGWKIVDEAIGIQNNHFFEWIKIEFDKMYSANKIKRVNYNIDIIDEIGPILFERRDSIALSKLEYKYRTWGRKYSETLNGTSEEAKLASDQLKQMLIEAEKAIEIMKNK